MQAQPFATESFEPKTAEILEFPRTVPSDFQEPSSNSSRIPEWTKPLSSTEIAEILAPIFGAKIDAFQRNLSNWFKVVKEAYCWLPETDLRVGSGKTTRYLPFCCQQFESLAQVGKDGYDLWISSVHAANPDQFTVTETSKAELVKPESVPTSNTAMIPYQPQEGEIERFLPPERKIRKFTSTEEFVSTAKQSTETALEVTQSNSTSLTEALIKQMAQEGQKLGLTLFQAKYGTAQAVMADLEETLAKKSGLETETAADSPS